jgi:hypothetical protein
MNPHCGTTLFGVVTNDGIVIGADSMIDYDGHANIFRKLQIVRNAVIACEGLGVINERKPGKTVYRADQWMAKIESRLAIEMDAAAIAAYIRKRHPFLRLIRIEQHRQGFEYEQVRKGYLTDFLIASIFQGRVSLLRVRLSVNLKERRLIFTTTTHFNGLAPASSFVYYGAGRLSEINKAFGGQGDAYQDMLVGTNGNFGRLVKGEKVSLDELRDIVRCAISLEAKANPETVGPPFVIATLQPSKPVAVASYS